MGVSIAHKGFSRTLGMAFAIGILIGAVHPMAAEAGSNDGNTRAQSRAIEGVWEPRSLAGWPRPRLWSSCATPRLTAGEQ